MKAGNYHFLFWAWMALIWILSSIPQSGIPDLNDLGFDKIAHFGIYLVWGIWAALYLFKRQAGCGHSALIFAIMMLLATLDEYHQHYIPGRQVSFWDLLANWSGLIVAYAGYLIYQRKSSR